jgi:glycine cleavage system H protein
VLEVNEDLLETPEIINEDPYDKGWIAVIEIENDSELDDLMDAADYGNTWKRSSEISHPRGRSRVM